MASIKVTLAQLARPLQVKSVSAGTTLKKFLEANNLAFNSSIRVNAKTATASYKLKKDDIICVVQQVSGGKQ